MDFVSKLERERKDPPSFRAPNLFKMPAQEFEALFTPIIDYYSKIEDGQIYVKSFKKIIRDAFYFREELLTETDNELADILQQLYDRFDEHDTRTVASTVYPVDVVLMVYILCALTGKHSLPAVVEYWRFYNPYLQLMIPNMPSPEHIPTHETIRTVLKLVPPKEMELFFADYFSKVITDIIPCDAVPESEDKSQSHRPKLAFDGQEVRASWRRGETSRKKKGAISVSVYECASKSVLGYTTTDCKGTEDKAFVSIIPKLSVMNNAIVCADAINTKKVVFDEFNKYGIDYLFPVKDNRKVLREAINSAFENAPDSDHLVYVASPEKSSGRITERKYTLIKAPLNLPNDQSLFNRTKCLLRYETITQQYNKAKPQNTKTPSTEIKDYITSLDFSQESFKELIHSIEVYWSIESHHNTLDTVFMQDFMNMCDKEHLSNRIGINKIVYNILTYQRQLQGLKSKTPTYPFLADKCNKDPETAFAFLCAYWTAGAPQPVKTPKRIPTLITD